MRKERFSPGEYYHIYNRGNSKQMIFKDPQDYRRFLALLYLCNNTHKPILGNIFRSTKDTGFATIFNMPRERSLVSIMAYCLLPNHYHLLLREGVEGGISQFMQKAGTAFVMYFNNKYDRKGSLFEGPFRSRHVDHDAYLRWLFAYIHLNPLSPSDRQTLSKIQLLEKLQGYKYSSFTDYIRTNVIRPQRAILPKKLDIPLGEPIEVLITQPLDWKAYESLE